MPFLVRYIAQIPKVGLKYRLMHFWRYLNISHIIAYIRYRFGLMRDAKYYKKHNPELRKFEQFRNRYIIQSPKIYLSLEELEAEDWDADAFVVGSDQVWNCPAIHRPIYFLQFVRNAKRIAYAASFGKNELDEEYKSDLPDLLRKFCAVGVREDRGLEFCQEAGRNDAVVVCDPTLLLTKQFYVDNLLDGCCTSESNHLFCYLINWQTRIPMTDIKRFAYDNSLDIRYFNAHALELSDFVEPYDDLTIESWLRSLISSRYVCTNSFHGVIFSILMHRSFIVLPLQGIYSGMNSRINALLDRLGLSDRIFREDSNFERVLNMPIDWGDVELRLNEFRESSESFLKKVI